VFDPSTGEPIEGAEVSDVLRKVSAVTTKTGTISLSFLPAGSTLLQVRKVGYEPTLVPVLMSATDTVPITVLLEKSVVTLDPVVTRDSATKHLSPGLQAFEERRAHARGSFISNEELRRDEQKKMSDVIRRLPGLKVTCGRFPSECRATSTRQSTKMAVLGGACIPDMYMDGIVVTDSDLDKIVVRDIAGIEYYPGAASVPVQYNKTGSNCGVLLFWSRDR